MKKYLKKLTVSTPILFLAFVIAIGSFGAYKFTETAGAATVGELLNQAASLEAQIRDNEAKVNQLASEVDSLKKKIAEFDLEISNAQAQIDLTSIRISVLEDELVKAQAELDRQKELLKISLRALYKKGDVSSFELLVGSQSFTQFVNQQEYLERLKGGIQKSTEKVIELKQQIQTNKETQEKLLAEQQAAKIVIEEMRTERAVLLQETQGQEAKYRAITESQQAELRKTEQTLASMLSGGVFVSLGPVSKGDIIGRVGSTGFSTGPHLHLEARRPGDGREIDPMNFLGGEWDYPVQPVEVTQYFGENNGYFYGAHKGMDFGGTGKTVHATASGSVIARGWSQDQPLLGGSSAYGYVVIIQHFNGYFSVYAHMTPPS